MTSPINGGEASPIVELHQVNASPDIVVQTEDVITIAGVLSETPNANMTPQARCDWIKQPEVVVEIGRTETGKAVGEVSCAMVCQGPKNEAGDPIANLCSDRIALAMIKRNEIDPKQVMKFSPIGKDSGVIAIETDSEGHPISAKKLAFDGDGFRDARDHIEWVSQTGGNVENYRKIDPEFWISEPSELRGRAGGFNELVDKAQAATWEIKEDAEPLVVAVYYGDCVSLSGQADLKDGRKIGFSMHIGRETMGINPFGVAREKGLPYMPAEYFRQMSVLHGSEIDPSSIDVTVVAGIEGEDFKQEFKPFVKDGVVVKDRLTNLRDRWVNWAENGMLSVVDPGTSNLLTIDLEDDVLMSRLTAGGDLDNDETIIVPHYREMADLMLVESLMARFGLSQEDARERIYWPEDSINTGDKDLDIGSHHRSAMSRSLYLSAVKASSVEERTARRASLPQPSFRR